jgi:hypothetical protein
MNLIVFVFVFQNSFATFLNFREIDGLCNFIELLNLNLLYWLFDLVYFTLQILFLQILKFLKKGLLILS